MQNGLSLPYALIAGPLVPLAEGLSSFAAQSISGVSIILPHGPSAVSICRQWTRALYMER